MGRRVYAAPRIALHERDPLDPPSVNTDGLDGELEPRRLRMGGEPGTRSGEHTPRFLRVDHLERMPEVGTALLFHLDDHEATAAPEHEIELVPARAHVRIEEAVAAKPVVTKGAPLATIHAAS